SALEQNPAQQDNYNSSNSALPLEGPPEQDNYYSSALEQEGHYSAALEEGREYCYASQGPPARPAGFQLPRPKQGKHTRTAGAAGIALPGRSASPVFKYC
ncbi:unnamed protein product, partial [Amoebophrya sp. A25]